MTAQATQVYSVFVRATPEQVWDAITKPEFTSKYFYGSVIESTWEPGATYAGWAGDRSQQYVDGEVIEASPPQQARHDVAGALRPRDRGGAVQPRHVGDRAGGRRRHEAHRRPRRARGAPKTAENVAGGWSYVLSGLKTLLETGEPLAG